MAMAAYYNEIDPYAAQWLRNLITAGHIAPGDVDERSIEDVRPDDLRGYTQCHFFAGIGVWSSALRLAGWPDDRPVWTGSCPCQPFSAAGKGLGFADERHLWPAWHHLISERRPPVIFGEQVASKDVDPWIDLVFDDLEAVEYACAANPFPSAGVGAPHIRDRTFFVAHAYHARSQGRKRVREHAAECIARTRGVARELADASEERQQQHAQCDGESGAGREEGQRRDDAGRRRVVAREPESAGPTNGFWRAADWLLCRDGKWRPVESQPQPLVDGSAESLGLVRADIITALTEEINAAAMETKVIGAEAMRDVWDHLGTQAKRCWPSRGLPGLHEAPFLLAFVRQLASQGWLLAQGISLSRPEASGESLRGLRDDEALAGASHRRELDEQRSGERPDVVRVLSCILARHAQEAWGEAYKTYAAIGFPLSTGEPARVGRLRAYGNAINREAAAAFIAAADEAMTA
jgi:site-specific DNA-cytosine methylase